MPQTLFSRSGYLFVGTREYDVAPDGRRFLVRAQAAAMNGEASGKEVTPQVLMIQNWTEELKRLVP